MHPERQYLGLPILTKTAPGDEEKYTSIFVYIGGVLHVMCGVYFESHSGEHHGPFGLLLIHISCTCSKRPHQAYLSHFYTFFYSLQRTKFSSCLSLKRKLKTTPSQISPTIQTFKSINYGARRSDLRIHQYQSYLEISLLSWKGNLLGRGKITQMRASGHYSWPRSILKRSMPLWRTSNVSYVKEKHGDYADYHSP